MLSSFINNLSILKKFLFINLLVFVIFGSLTIVYLIGIKPNLIHKKTLNHIQIIDNTIEHIRMLRIQFNEDDIKQTELDDYGDAAGDDYLDFFDIDIL